MTQSVKSRRRGLLVGGAIVGIFVVAIPAATAVADGKQHTAESPAAVECDDGTLLAMPEGPFRAAVDSVSANGEYMAGISYEMREDEEPTSKDPSPDKLLRVQLWHDGEVTTIDTPDEITRSRSNDKLRVNSNGTIVNFAVSAIGEKDYKPWVHRSGETSVLPGADEQGWAAGVNDHDDVTGVRTNDGHDQPVVWTAESDYTEVVDLPLPEGASNGTARDISDEGIVVGWVEYDNGPQEAYMWDAEGNGSELARPDDFGTTMTMDAVAISGDWIGGRGHQKGEGYSGVRWNIAEAAQPETLDIDSVHDINSSGDIAGAKSLRPVALFGDEFQWLNNPLDEPVAGGQAWGISEDGSLVAGEAFAEESIVVYPVSWGCQ